MDTRRIQIMEVTGMDLVRELDSIPEVASVATREELLELLELTDKWASPDDGKFLYYQPNPVPFVFHQSPAHIRAIFGGNRSGKTYSSVLEASMSFLGREPKSLQGLIPKHRLDPTRRQRFCMADYPNSFTKVIWPTFQQLIPPGEIIDIVKDAGRIKAITNSKGGFIEFMQYDQDISKFPGASRHVIFYDEEPPESIRDENMMRIVDTDGEEVFSLTPISGALKWIYDSVYLKASRIVEKRDGGIKDVSVPSGDPDIHVFFASIFDNKVVPKAAALRILSKYPEEERIVRERGHFIFLSGLVYKQYSDDVHLIDPFNEWWEPRTRSFYTLYVAIDPHPRTPHAVLFLCVRKDGLHFIVDEIYEECKAPKLVKLIKDKCRGVTPEVILIDPIASTPDPSTKSCLLYDLVEAGLDNPIPIAASKDKDRGIMRCQNRLELGEQNIPGIYVCSNCSRFRFEISRYSWDDWKKDTRNTKGLKQKPVDKDDHMMENWYRIENLDPWYSSPYTEEDDWEPYRDYRGRSVMTGY